MPNKKGQTWLELHLIYRGNPTADKLFEFKRNALLPSLQASGVKYYLILDEPGYTLIRFRWNLIWKALVPWLLRSKLKKGAPYSGVNTTTWSPDQDARSRIASALQKIITASQGQPNHAGGFAVDGKDAQGKWILKSEDLDKQVDAFTTYMSKVAGHFTEEYIRHMPYRVSDRWLMSVFIHLLLDSISTHKGEESGVREFPYI